MNHPRQRSKPYPRGDGKKSIFWVPFSELADGSNFDFTFKYKVGWAGERDI